MPSEYLRTKKLLAIEELYRKGIEDVKRSGDDFLRFLDFSIPFTELSFDNQLIVYEQRPLAKRLASYDGWHTCYGRGCGKGKGILLLSESKDNYKYVFDVADTYLLRDHTAADDRQLEEDYWTVPSALKEYVGKFLEQSCGSSRTISDFLSASDDEVSTEAFETYSGLPDNSVKALLTSSVEYVVALRCGVLDADKRENLKQLLNDNVPVLSNDEFIDVVSTIQSVSQIYLDKIHTIVLDYERSIENGGEISLQEIGFGLSSDDRSVGTSGIDREIRNTAEEVSYGNISDKVYSNESAVEPEQGIGGVQQESVGRRAETGGADSGERESADAGESGGSDRLGGVYEEHSGAGRGDNNGRNGAGRASFLLGDYAKLETAPVYSRRAGYDDSGQTSLFPVEDLITEAEEIADKAAAVFDASSSDTIADDPEKEAAAFETVIAAVGHGDIDSESVITDEDIDNVIINCVYNHLVKGTICSLINQYNDMTQAERDKFLLSDIEQLFANHTLPVVNSRGRDIEIEFDESAHGVNLTDTVSGDTAWVSRRVFCGTRLFDLYKDGLFLEPSLERDSVTAYLALNQPFRVYASGLNSFPENVRDNFGAILFERLLNPEQQKRFMADYSDLVSLKDFENYRTEYVDVIADILEDLHNTGAVFDDILSDDSSVHLKLAVGEDDDTVLYVSSSAGDLHANANFIAGSIIQSAVEGKITQDNVKQDTSIQKDDFATNSGIVSARWYETGEYDYEGHDKNAVSSETLNEPFRAAVDYTLENLSAMSAYELAKNILDGYRDAVFAQDYYNRDNDRYVTFDKLDPLFNNLLSGDILGAEKTKEVMSIVFDTLLNGKHENIANAFFSHEAILDIPFVKNNFPMERAELASHYANYRVTDQNIEEILVGYFTYSAYREPERYEKFYRTVTDSETSSKDKIAYLKGSYGQGSHTGLGLFQDGYYGSGEVSSFKADGLEFTKGNSDYTKADRRFLKWPAVLRAYQTYIMEGKMPEPAEVYEQHSRWRASRGYGIVYEPETDIFTADAEAIVNPVNTVGVMGKGLALAFKEKYPEMFKDYKARCDNGTFDTGSICYFRNEENEPDVICFPTKKDWRDKSELEYVSSGLDALREYIEEHYVRSIAIPKLGCGLGGLSWNEVRSLMEEKLGDLNCKVIVLGEAPEQTVNLETEDVKTAEPVQENLDFGDSDTEGLRRGSTIFDTADNETQPADDVNAAVIDNTPYYDYEIPAGGFLRGGDKMRFADNVQAIITLKRIESEKRRATPEEQDILAKYVGWGGLASAFDPTKKEWAKEYAELRQILTTDEYKTASESVLSAYYTPQPVVKAVYNILDKAGFHGGRILDPSMGIGNFFGNMPREMRDASELFGIELDSISGRIAKQLYQSAHIDVAGFEKTALPDGVFDLVVSNIPFGDFSVNDPAYNKYKFPIHDYFFAKAVNKVRPGGIVAFITSTGTLDKNNSALRDYMAQRADLLGAIRLPHTTFTEEAGTEASSDIIFFRRKEREIVYDENNKPSWVGLDSTDIYVNEGSNRRRGSTLVNSYFAENPEMVLGTLETGVVKMYGRNDMLACVPFKDKSLEYYLDRAANDLTDYSSTVASRRKLPFAYSDASDEQKSAIYRAFNPVTGAVGDWIPATPEMRDYSFAVGEGDEIYFREGAMARNCHIKDKKMRGRIAGLVRLADETRRIISMQTDGADQNSVMEALRKISRQYDDFTAVYGRINSKANMSAFADDTSLYLLCSLENLDNKGHFVSKSVFFDKPTVARSSELPEHTDNADDALMYSLCYKLCVDMSFMEALTDKTEKELTEELAGKIYFNPVHSRYETAEEFLSGNILEKVKAQMNIRDELADPKIQAICDANIEALFAVLPKPLKAEDIDVRLGVNWLPPDIVKDFIVYLLEPNNSDAAELDVYYDSTLASWFVDNTPSRSHDTVLVSETYGFADSGKSAYFLVEDILNLRNTNLYMTVDGEDGKPKRVFDPERSRQAAAKQELVRQKFSEWVYADSKRRERIEAIYNERYRSTVVREYDGSFLRFSGQSVDISLLPHQKNAVARILFGGNTLLAHAVGAGKTFEMITGAMESKRFGLCNKPALIVPKGLVEQTALEFVRLYPAANILVADKNSFNAANRKKMTAKLVTGDYDAVIMSYEQFGKIAISTERQLAMLDENIKELETVIKLAEDRGDRKSSSVKQLIKTLKNYTTRRKQLFDKMKLHKDDFVEFEMTGIDRIFVDEAHNFKNLHIITKMANVRGISTTTAQKSEDMYMKCRYLNEITNNKGVVFATGTPISNSMTEMYTMMRYLQHDTLVKAGVGYFDEWAATFGETVTQMELMPHGGGFQSVRRFAQFFNVPELMTLFRQTADIQTADMLNLDVPDANFIKVEAQCSEQQAEVMASLAKRAQAIHDKLVDPHEDNMLAVCSDGKKCGLDVRLLNDPFKPDYFTDDPESKVNICVNNLYDIWKKTADKRSTQVVFCDFSTPYTVAVSKEDPVTNKSTRVARFNVYEDMKAKLIAKGIPPEEIAFIHDTDDQKKREDMLDKFRHGEIRILFGSTQKLGTGVNIQDKLLAAHHLDAPWRPADVEQRNGRIIRRNNENPAVDIYTYITVGTFDAYLFQTLKSKQTFISQIMSNKNSARRCSDVDAVVLQYAEIMACAIGDPRLKEFAEVDNNIIRLTDMLVAFNTGKNKERAAVSSGLPDAIAQQERIIEKLRVNMKVADENSALDPVENFAGMTFDSGIEARNKETATKQLLLEIDGCKLAENRGKSRHIGKYCGHDMYLGYDYNTKTYALDLEVPGAMKLTVKLLGDGDTAGSVNYIVRIDNVLKKIDKNIEAETNELVALKKQLESYKSKLNEPFPFQAELEKNIKRMQELKNELGIKDKDMDTDGGVEDGVVHRDDAEAEIEESVDEDIIDTDFSKFNPVTEAEDAVVCQPLTELQQDAETVAAAENYCNLFPFADPKKALNENYRLIEADVVGDLTEDWKNAHEEIEENLRHVSVRSIIHDSNKDAYWYIFAGNFEDRIDENGQTVKDFKLLGFTEHVPEFSNGINEFWLSDLQKMAAAETGSNGKTDVSLVAEKTVPDYLGNASRVMLHLEHNAVVDSYVEKRKEREAQYAEKGWESGNYLRNRDFWNTDTVYCVVTRIDSDSVVSTGVVDTEWLKVPENVTDTVVTSWGSEKTYLVDYFRTKEEAQKYVDSVVQSVLVDVLKREKARQLDGWSLDVADLTKYEDSDFERFVYSPKGDELVSQFKDLFFSEATAEDIKDYKNVNDCFFSINSYACFDRHRRESLNSYMKRSFNVWKEAEHSNDIER